MQLDHIAQLADSIEVRSRAIYQLINCMAIDGLTPTSVDAIVGILQSEIAILHEEINSIIHIVQE